MLHKTLTILSLIGLLLSVGAWGMSYWNIKAVLSSQRPTIQLSRGTVWIYWDHYGSWPLSRYEVQGFTSFSTDWAPRWQFSRTVSMLQIPLWCMCILFASLAYRTAILRAALGLHPGHRRCRKRMMLGLCQDCGYDLRGSKDRCPECGQEFIRATLER